jgi:hypothetical protein
MSIHFLRYSVLAAHLSPPLSGTDLTDTIAGHFPPYVQRALLSSSVKTVQEALRFLNKPETLEGGDPNRRSNPGQVHNKTPQNNASDNSNQNRYDWGKNYAHQARNRGYRGRSNCDSNQWYGRYDRRPNKQYTDRSHWNAGDNAVSHDDARAGNFNLRVDLYSPTGSSAYQNSNFNNGDRARNRASENSNRPS